MNASELREKYLNFFEKKGHKVIPSAPLVPSEKVELSGTQKLLFTTAGMHPLIPYLLGEDHPAGKKLTNVQKSLRTDDIDVVGDNWHNTFFEMLGNWSLGDYWKKEAIGWSFEFIKEELKLPTEKLWVTVFAGDEDAPKDTESIEIWKSLGIPVERIVPLPKKDNWWGPVGETGPCGPDTEMFIDVSGKAHGENCLPGDGCGRFSEIWNDVFMEYDRQKDGSYKPLKQKNVDTGMGVERTTAILQGKDNIYETDLFASAMEIIKSQAKNYEEKSARVISDHLRASVFLLAEGIIPSNVDRGYVLRRLVRRAIRHTKVLGAESSLIQNVVDNYIEDYSKTYPELKENFTKICDEMEKEVVKFQKALDRGLVEFAKTGDRISGQETFDLYQNYGFPIELTVELAEEKGKKVDVDGFEKAYSAHRDQSRAGAEKKFAGGLADHSDTTVRGHTATHLLHQALRDVLGDNVHQTGSNITPERIRFDFSHPEKLTEDQVKKVEDIVNKKINEDLQVKKEMMSQEEADKKGAIGLFKDKYEDKVSIYEIGDYSTEYCGGPHVEHTSQVGTFKILKEEALGAGQRRIRAVLS